MSLTDENIQEIIYHQKNQKDWNLLLKIACNHGYIDLVNIAIKNNATNWDDAFLSACGGANIDILNIILENGLKSETKFDWEKGIRYACGNRDGNIEFVIHFIEIMKKLNIPVNYKTGLIYASYRGNMDITKFILNKCNKHNISIDLEEIFLNSCGSGNVDLTKFIFEKIKSKTNITSIVRVGFYGTCFSRHTNILNFLLDKFEANLDYYIDVLTTIDPKFDSDFDLNMDIYFKLDVLNFLIQKGGNFYKINKRYQKKYLNQMLRCITLRTIDKQKAFLLLLNDDLTHNLLKYF